MFPPESLPRYADFKRYRKLIPDVGSACRRYGVLSANRNDEKILLRVRERSSDYSEEKAVASVLRGMPSVEYYAFYCTKKAHVFVQVIFECS